MTGCRIRVSDGETITVQATEATTLADGSLWLLVATEPRRPAPPRLVPVLILARGQRRGVLAGGHQSANISAGKTTSRRRADATPRPGGAAGSDQAIAAASCPAIRSAIRWLLHASGRSCSALTAAHSSRARAASPPRSRPQRAAVVSRPETRTTARCSTFRTRRAPALDSGHGPVGLQLSPAGLRRHTGPAGLA